ncbi:MAG: GlxA family transcriptional regulator [Solirubrobacteraceae bacterium]
MRRVVIVLFGGVQALDVTGPAEVFSIATRLGRGSYRIELAAAEQSTTTTSSGLLLVPHRTLGSIRQPVDTLIVPGGEGTREAMADERLIRWIARAGARARRVTSVCTGAFLLAEAGLLDGRRATTHWSACGALKRRYPQVSVESDPIFLRDGNVWTSAGVTAGMDLSLALLEEDAGSEAALAVARQLVMFVRRPGGQAQFSTQLSARLADREPLRAVQDRIVQNLQEDLSVEALAAGAHMSPRNFARAFKREVGVTPAVYVERVRVERAQQLLQDHELTLPAVALRCGFGSEDRMRRAFHRRVGVGPAAYRSRFRPALSRAA